MDQRQGPTTNDRVNATMMNGKFKDSQSTEPRAFRGKLLLATGMIVLVLAIGLGLITVSNDIASQKAFRLNASIIIGEPIDDVISKAKKVTPVFFYDSEKQKAYFVFHGFVFYKASCIVIVENGRVKSNTYIKAFD
jgi:hypothetical protein